MLAVSLYRIRTVSCAETEARRPRCRFVLNRNSLVYMSLAETKARRPRRKFVLNQSELSRVQVVGRVSVKRGGQG